ncbi:hypothetical protein SAMN05880582_101294 [Rhizobium sp. RU20A]|uniref:hypothetical protein n=1 Tax=Rhizobium sp. RU20A TaxID=1907412 RepID=UPI000957241F|nr:hypothetical protein [Rhizobium sp. RU20A]SIP99030.1 hypothetical protein SAMN05880582_101294 [Rhizobium sp. RU20A]
MQDTQKVVERALAAVAQSRALRERQQARRKAVFSRIEAATIKITHIPKGIQLPLNLQ